MSGAHRGLILEIQGSLTHLTSDPNLPVSWGTARGGLKAAPISPVQSLDLSSFETDAGGASVATTYLDDILEQYKTSPTAMLTQDASIGDATLHVQDATSLPSAGHVWIGRNAIAYTGTTANTITGCTWGQLGTGSYNELAGAVVYGWNPAIIDRQAWLYWYDYSTQTKALKFTGFIDDIQIGAEETLLTLLSAKTWIIQSPGLEKDFATGRLLQDMGTDGPKPLLVQWDDPNRPIPTDKGLKSHIHVRIGDEVIAYASMITPRLQDAVTLIPGTNQVRTGPIGAGFFIEETVDIHDGTFVRDTVQITKSEQISLSEFEISYSSSSGYTPSVSDTLQANYSGNINTHLMERGAVGTQIDEHKKGAEVKEIRVLEGDQLEDILLPLLFSNTGNGTAGPFSGKYDVLPDGWGLGLDASLVDVQSFLDNLSLRSSYRRYRMEDSLDIELLLRWISISTNSIIFWGNDGILTCVARTDIYPGMTPRLNISVEHTRIPELRIAGQYLINEVEWRTDYTIDGQPLRIIRVKDRESSSIRTRHQKREAMEDHGVILTRSREQIYVVHRGLLMLRARPTPLLMWDVQWDENNPYTLGELVLVDIAAFPNFQGGQGLLATFEIIDISPQDDEGRLSLVLMMRPAVVSTGLIAPWSIVAEVGAGFLRMEGQSDTHAAPPGQEDVELFQVGDPIHIWDVSSFGSGSTNKFATTINTIDVPTKTITPAALPSIGVEGWECAPGDLMTFGDYTTVKAGPTADDRIGVYLALATGSPLSLDGDEPYQWGV